MACWAWEWWAQWQQWHWASSLALAASTEAEQSDAMQLTHATATCSAVPRGVVQVVPLLTIRPTSRPCACVTVESLFSLV
jgi:hypothetical protein